MRKNEFRIGNLIEGYLEPQISEWVEMKVCVDVLSSIESKPDNHGYRPIPLTEELLVKLGFVGDNHKYHETFYIDISTDERLEIKTTIDIHIMDNYGVAYITDNEMDIDINTCFIRKINHVHQLQNLYYAITGKELTLKTEQ